MEPLGNYLSTLHWSGTVCTDKERTDAYLDSMVSLI